MTNAFAPTQYCMSFMSKEKHISMKKHNTINQVVRVHGFLSKSVLKLNYLFLVVQYFKLHL